MNAILWFIKLPFRILETFLKAAAGAAGIVIGITIAFVVIAVLFGTLFTSFIR